MKLFTYLSALLITTGAAFGIIDYTKAKNSGTLDKLYVEEQIEEVSSVKNEPLVNNDVVKKEAVFAKNVSPNENRSDKKVVKTTTPTTVKTTSNIKPMKESTKSKEKEIKQPKAPVTDVMELQAVIVSENEKNVVESKKDAAIAPPPAPRKIDYRDFGRGSIRPRKIKIQATKPLQYKLKEK